MLSHGDFIQKSEKQNKKETYLVTWYVLYILRTEGTLSFAGNVFLRRVHSTVWDERTTISIYLQHCYQGCEWEFKKRAEIVLKTQKWPENTRKDTFWGISTTTKELTSALKLNSHTPGIYTPYREERPSGFVKHGGFFKHGSLWTQSDNDPRSGWIQHIVVIHTTMAPIIDLHITARSSMNRVYFTHHWDLDG